METAKESAGWLTYEQAAQQLGCSTKTIQRRVREGQLHPYLLGSGNTRWLQAHQVAALQPSPAEATQ